ncbi:branched-chain amino acid ABC transporter permease [Bordetella pertussis]|nr:branched-chain amino acid ABC transporter permease [Bordetella pertussis]
MNLLQQLINGIVLGHAYALIAIGWTLLLGVARLVNFGHGQMYMVGAFVTWWATTSAGMPYLLALPTAMALGALIGLAMQRIMLRATFEQNLVSIMIMTLGFGYVIQGAASLIFGSTGQILDTAWSQRDIEVGELWVTWQDAAIVVAAIAVFAGLKWLLEGSRAGRLVRMVAEDPKLAQLAGVDVRRIYYGVFAFEGAAVAFAAGMVAPRTPILTSMGFEEVIITFVVVVLGGIGSVTGSYAAGVALGVFTALFSALVSPTYATAAAFLVLIGVLVLRPGGLSAGAGGALMIRLPLRRAALLPLAVIVLYLPAWLGGSPAIYSAAVLIAILAVMSYGLDVVVSDLGEVSLGHTVFFATGAYVTALLSTRTGAGAWITLAATIVAALGVSAVVGLVTLRLREFVFSLVTYAVAVVAVTVAANWAFLGGSDGLRGLPTLDLSVAGLSLTARNDEELWPYAFGLLVVVIYLIDRFRHSRLGTAAIMVHQNPRLATMSGIDPARVRLQVFLFSAPISAAAGWLYAYQRAYVSADILETYFLILMLTAVVLVGRRQLLGPLLATALVLVQEKFFSFGGYVDKIVLGSVLVLVLAFFPQGLMGLVRPLARLARRRQPASPVATTLENPK